MFIVAAAGDQINVIDERRAGAQSPGDDVEHVERRQAQRPHARCNAWHAETEAEAPAIAPVNAKVHCQQAARAASMRVRTQNPSQPRRSFTVSVGN